MRHYIFLWRWLCDQNLHAPQGDNDEWGKHDNFEHATRIPFMVRLPQRLFPKFSPGRSRAFVETVDLFPTLVELALGAAPGLLCAGVVNSFYIGQVWEQPMLVWYCCHSTVDAHGTPCVTTAIARCPEDLYATRKTLLCTEGLSFTPLLLLDPSMQWKK